MQVEPLPFVVTRTEKLFAAVSSSVKQLRQNYDETFNAWCHSRQVLSDTLSKLTALNDSYQQLQQQTNTEKTELTLNIQRLQASEAELLNKLKDVASRYALVCSAISPDQQQSLQYKNFKTLINDKFLPLLNRINVVASEAEQVMKIRAVDDELRLAEAFSAFTQRTVVAVAGSFSSGKSSFISSLLDTKAVSLPIGVEPVTAIPTYVVHASKLKISGYPKDGGCFEIPPAIYARLSHKFVEEFGFNLRDLLPFMSLEVPFKAYKHLAFIDLPGYNPGERDGLTTGDKSASQEFITQAHALIWMIGLDANGTLPRDDLEHLWDLTQNDIPLYVVLNKADLRPASTLDEVLDQIVEELMLAGINYKGVCAYSSEDGGELKFRETSLWQVLTEWDKPRQARLQIYNKLEEVLSLYEEALQTDILLRQKKSGLIKSLELNLLELGAFDVADSTDFRLDRYFKDSSELGKEPKAKLTSIFTVLSTLAVHNPTIVKKYKENNKLKKNKTEDAPAPQKLLELRESLINNTKDQIQQLRDDYATKQAESDLAELRHIRRHLQSILLG